MEQSLWKLGKQETKRFEEITLKGFKGTLAFLLSLVFTIIAVLPVAILIYQLIVVYSYHPYIFPLILIFSWLTLLFCNGLSNLITLELSKAYYPDNSKLQNINSKALFVYQSLNIGYAIWMIVMIILVLLLLK